MFRRACAAGAVALVFITGGCGDVDPEQATEDLDALQARIVSGTEEAVAALGEVGQSVQRAAGVAEYCGLQPSPGATYRTGALLTEAGDPAEQVAEVRDVLVELGWTVESEADAPTPHVSLSRDDLRASVDVSRREDEPGTTFGLTGPCIDVPDDFSLADDDRRVDIVAEEAERADP